MPVAFWTFLIAGCSLAGLPFVTAGFFSKDLIIWEAWSAQQGHPGFWLAAMIGALLTSLYTFRVILRVFFGPLGTPVTKRPGYAMTVPLLILAFLSVVGGYIKNPLLGFLDSALPRTIEAGAFGMTEIRSEVITALLFLIGLYCAYLFHSSGGVWPMPWSRTPWGALCINGGLRTGAWIGCTAKFSCSPSSGFAD